MNKQQLIEQVAFAADLTKKQAKEAIEAVTSVIERSLAEGEPVVLVGFGTFEVKERPARTGRNPATGQAMEFAASKTPRFRAGNQLKKAVN